MNQDNIGGNQTSASKKAIFLTSEKSCVSVKGQKKNKGGLIKGHDRDPSEGSISKLLVSRERYSERSAAVKVLGTGTGAKKSRKSAARRQLVHLGQGQT